MKGRRVVSLSIVFPNDMKKCGIGGSRDRGSITGQISARRKTRVVDQDRARGRGLTRWIGSHREMDNTCLCGLGGSRKGRQFIKRLHGDRWIRGWRRGGRRWAWRKIGKARTKGGRAGGALGKRTFHSQLYDITCFHALHGWKNLTSAHCVA